MQNQFKPLLIANWKMNPSKEDALELIARLNTLSYNDVKLIICPPATLIDPIASVINENILLGAQDCSIHGDNYGAFTGELSAYMLKSIGASYVILGHSERRLYHKETNEIVKIKASNAHAVGLNTIICVGEPIEAKQNKYTLDYIKEQIINSIPDSANPNNTIIAYEPIWAIGSGKIPEFLEISDVHQYVSELINKNFSNMSVSFENKFKVVYGGSVKSENASKILALDSVKGLLIGGASLVIDQISKIIISANESNKFK
jgi:triosephosphate isomerase